MGKTFTKPFTEKFNDDQKCKNDEIELRIFRRNTHSSGRNVRRKEKIHSLVEDFVPEQDYQGAEVDYTGETLEYTRRKKTRRQLFSLDTLERQKRKKSLIKS